MSRSALREIYDAFVAATNSQKPIRSFFNDFFNREAHERGLDIINENNGVLHRDQRDADNQVDAFRHIASQMNASMSLSPGAARIAGDLVERGFS